jgi:hypothetical protein
VPCFGRCVLSPVAQQQRRSDQQRPEKVPEALSSRELKQRAAGHAAAELQAPGEPGGEGGRVAQLPSSPPGNAGGVTGVLSPPCAEAAAAQAAPAAGDCARQARSPRADVPCDLAWGGVAPQGHALAAQRPARERGAAARHTSLDHARRWRPTGAEGASSGSDGGAGGAAAPAHEQPWPQGGLQPDAAPLARPGYYDPPPSGRRRSQPARPARVQRRKSEPAARSEAGDHRCMDDFYAECYAGPGRERRPVSRGAHRGSCSPERWPRLRGRGAAGAFAESSAADCASHPAHDPARNRAVLAAAARRPPRVDRVARYQCVLAARLHCLTLPYRAVTQTAVGHLSDAFVLVCYRLRMGGFELSARLQRKALRLASAGVRATARTATSNDALTIPGHAGRCVL